MHYNRTPIAQCIEDDPWSHLCLNVEHEKLAESAPHAIVNIAGSTMLHQHEITFATGTSNCRAHAFAKMMAAAVIDGKYAPMPSLKVANRFDIDFIKKHINKLQQASHIPYIPRQKGINVLTYFNRPARPPPSLTPTNADHSPAVKS